MKGTITPLFRSDIPDSFREVPVVPVKVLSIILALPIRMIFRFAQDDSPVPPCALAVAHCVFDANLNGLGMIRRYISLADREAAFPRFHLDAVIGNFKTNAEAESL